MREIVLVAGTESGARALARQLSSYLEGRAGTRALWLDDPSSGALRSPIALRDPGDILLLSSALVRAELAEKGWLPAEGRLIVARRTVDPDALDRVVALPPGTRALFVNDRRETAEECVEALLDLGLDGVDWLPWYPGAPAPGPERRVAVVAGEPGLVPSGMDLVIDIGVRILDFGTLAELFGVLGLPAAEIGSFSRRYLATIVSLASRLARSTEEARRVSGHLGSVIDSLRNGILVYDAEGRVSVCNDELRSLLNLRPARSGSGPAGSGGERLGELLRSRELLDFLECRCGEETGVFRLAEGSVVVKRFDLEGSGAGGGGHTVAVFRDGRDAAAEASRLAREYRRRGHVAKWGMDDIVGESEAIVRAKRIAARLAATELTILLNGESGTGKELFASAIHASSDRASGPFLAVDLGALSDDLIESELFGHEEGAFTGARKGGKAGLFELADGGTLFLDEIGNISSKVQKRLLRVLQEKEVMRVGGTEIKRVDVRVIAATNEDLLVRATRGEFREDLYFRLKMGWLRIPPLRERTEDIPPLVRRFLALEGARGVAVDPAVLDALGSREWPGNVRELRNALTYMLAVREGEGIGLRDLPEEGYFAEEGLRPSRQSAPAGAADSGTEAAPGAGLPGGGLRSPNASFGSFTLPPRLPAAGGPGELGPADRLVLLALAELEAEGRHGGREAVAGRCAERGYSLGQGAVRAAFDRLSALGYVSSNRGRGGTQLTEGGRRLLAGEPVSSERISS
jgi:transcriptional regulator with PAS, ATPase and Fis domain